MRKISKILILLVITFTFIGCSNNSSKLLGKWKFESITSNGNTIRNSESLIWEINESDIKITTEGNDTEVLKYKINDKKQIEILGEIEKEIFKYKLKKNKLTLTNIDNEDKVVLSKIKNE